MARCVAEACSFNNEAVIHIFVSAPRGDEAEAYTGESYCSVECYQAEAREARTGSWLQAEVDNVARGAHFTITTDTPRADV